MKSIFNRVLSSVRNATLTPEKAKKKLEEMGESTSSVWGYRNDPEKVRLFLVAGGRVAVYDVITTISEGWVESVALMLQSPGLDINGRFRGDTLLTKAIAERQIAIVALLLASPGIDVNLKDLDDKSPLYIAAESGQSEIVALLLSTSGIDVNCKCCWRDRRSPLYIAASEGRVDCVRLLLNTKGIKVEDEHVRAARGHDLCEQMILAKKNSIGNRLRKIGEFFRDSW